MLLAFGKTLGQKIHGWPWGGSRIKPGVESLKEWEGWSTTREGPFVLNQKKLVHKDGKGKKTKTGYTAATIYHAEDVKGFYVHSLISYSEVPTSFIL